jgi:lysophospholipase L1-like esterase
MRRMNYQMLLLHTLRRSGTIAAPAVTPNMVVTLGDSIGKMAFDALITARPDLAITDLAIPGASLNGATFGSPGTFDLVGSQQLGTLLAMAQRPEVVIIECGANDLLNYADGHGSTGSGYMAQRKALLVDPIKSWSPSTKIIIATVLARRDHASGDYAGGDFVTAARMNTYRAQDRTAIFAAQTAGQIDYVADYQTDVPLGDDNYPSSGVAPDGVHPSSTYTPRLVDLYSGAIDAVRSGLPDTKPLDFTFPAVSNAAQNTDILSDPVTIEHLGPGQSATVTGRYTKNSTNLANITTTPGTVVHGDVIRAAAHSSSSAGATVNQDVTIGGITRTFSVATVGAVPVSLAASTEGIQGADYGATNPAQVDVTQTCEAGLIFFGWFNDRNNAPATIAVFAPSDTGKTSPITANRIDGAARSGSLKDSTAVYVFTGAETGTYTFRIHTVSGAWAKVAYGAVTAHNAGGYGTVIGWEGVFANAGDPHIAPSDVNPVPNGAWVALVWSAGTATWGTSGTGVAVAAGSMVNGALGVNNLSIAWGFGAGKPRWSGSVSNFAGVGAIIPINPS